MPFLFTLCKNVTLLCSSSLDICKLRAFKVINRFFFTFTLLISEVCSCYHMLPYMLPCMLPLKKLKSLLVLCLTHTCYRMLPHFLKNKLYIYFFKIAVTCGNMQIIAVNHCKQMVTCAVTWTVTCGNMLCFAFFVYVMFCSLFISNKALFACHK